MIEPFTIPGVSRGSQASPSSPLSSAAPSKFPESDTVRESISTIKPGSQHRSTARPQLSPPLENAFDNAKFVGRDGDSGTGSQAGSFDRSDSGVGDGLYILQPRTYTPALPTPIPSPMVKEYTPPTEPNESHSPSNPDIPKRPSLRQRTSAQGKLPESIQIPPPNIIDQFPRPRSSPKVHQCPPDSAYGSDGDQRNRPGSATAELSPSFHRPSMPSPRSDFQNYQPVQASPYSPLQQRPHTSHNSVRSATPPASASGAGHVRNQPSRLGGASTLSKVTTLTYGSEAGSGAEGCGGGGGAQEGQKGLKKKKSAFGWLKKAFTLDEEERAAFEARKGLSERNLYYEERSRAFLDGKRVKPHQR